MLKLLAASWFTPESEPAARYQIRAMTGLEFLEWQAIMAKPEKTNGAAKDGAQIMPADAIEHALRCGIVAWADVVDEQENPIAWEPSRVRAIPYLHVLEIAKKIVEMSMLTEDVEKNSSSQSKSPATESASTA
jgi:hypothetical protein